MLDKDFKSDLNNFQKKLLSKENFAFVRYNIQPQANQFILFPSNIMHLVEPHYEDKPRISISFNIDFSNG